MPCSVFRRSLDDRIFGLRVAAIEHLLAGRRSLWQRGLRNDRIVTDNFVDRTHGSAELGHRLFRRVQQTLDAALLGFGAERFINPTRWVNDSMGTVFVVEFEGEKIER